MFVMLGVFHNLWKTQGVGFTPVKSFAKTINCGKVLAKRLKNGQNLPKFGLKTIKTSQN